MSTDEQYQEWLAEEQRYRYDKQTERELVRQSQQIEYEADVRSGRPFEIPRPI